MIVKGTKQLGRLSSRKKDVNVYIPKVKKPKITSSLNTQNHFVCYQGFPFSYYITATNNPRSYNATNLPEGITINTSNGHIYGEAADQPAADRVITIYATNAAGTTSATFILSTFCTGGGDPPPPPPPPGPGGPPDGGGGGGGGGGD